MDFDFGQIVAVLPAPSLIRFKLFSLGQRWVIEPLRQLRKTDQRSLQNTLRRLLPCGDRTG